MIFTISLLKLSILIFIVSNDDVVFIRFSVSISFVLSFKKVIFCDTNLSLSLILRFSTFVILMVV